MKDLQGNRYFDGSEFLQVALFGFLKLIAFVIHQKSINARMFVTGSHKRLTEFCIDFNFLQPILSLRFMDWISTLDFDALQEDQQDMTSREIRMREQIANQEKELEKTKSKMRVLTSAIEEQAEMMRVMVATIDKIPKNELKKYID